jgi:hypothetical protein
MYPKQFFSQHFFRILREKPFRLFFKQKAFTTVFSMLMQNFITFVAKLYLLKKYSYEKNHVSDNYVFYFHFFSCDGAG